MRCSSCEPLLDAYLEATLRRRHALEVAEHLRECSECEALLGELRVIDGLLTTARPPGGVSRDFTAGVISATHATLARAPRRIPFLLPLFLYLAVAWTAVAFVALRSDNLLRWGEAFAWEQGRNLAALSAVIRAFAPATPIAAAIVTVVLLLDVFLLCALFYGYHRVRPLLALYIHGKAES